MSDPGRILWRSPISPDALVIVDGIVVVIDDDAVVALADDGGEVWRRTLARKPRRLVPCGRGIAVELADRAAPTQVVAFDLSGAELWRYERAWTLANDGMAGDARGVVLCGQDDGAANLRWVGLAATGEVELEVEAPSGAGPLLAGRWILSLVDGGERGLVRMERGGRGPEPLLSDEIGSWGVDDTWLLFGTTADPSEVVAIDLAEGRERWRAPGSAHNLELVIAGDRAAWVEGGPTGGRPVIYEVARGVRVWTGEPVPELSGHGNYTCRLGDGALVCYGERWVAYYTTTSSSAIVRDWDRDGPTASRFLDGRFYEASFHGLVCRKLS